MKSTGMVRRLDDLGRVVIPIEIRRHLQVAVKDPLEIYVEGDRIIIKKYGKYCAFCGCVEDLHDFRERCICPECLTLLCEERLL